MQVTVSEYIFSRLAEDGITDCFMVSGGGIMYLCEALGKNPDITYYCNYNEQACATAAEGYARVRNSTGCCLVTTGPGSTNAITGVASAWMDSIPMIVISGQVRTQIMADYKCQRQVGPQEVNIIPMVEPVTKYAVTVMEPEAICYELDKALHLAKTGRPGPVWLNIPLDIQSATIEPRRLKRYFADTCETLSTIELEEVEKMLRAAERPLLIGGNGITLSDGMDEFRKLVEQLEIPVVATISNMGILPEDHPQFQGRLGGGGQRRANFAIQNADLILAIGTSLSISCIGFNETFGKRAKKILVNIDPGDLKKKNITIDLAIKSDAKEFIIGLSKLLSQEESIASTSWLDACQEWKQNYPPELPEKFRQKDCVDVFDFYDELSSQMLEKDILVTGNSTDGCLMAYQGFKSKEGQIAFTSVCYGAMGWDLPAAVGAAVAGNGNRTVLVTGDGSIQFNIHELLTTSVNCLNLKMFISNNDGYQGIRNTQDRFFEGHYVGADATSGVGNPDFEMLAKAYNVSYLKISKKEHLKNSIEKVFSDDKPWLIELETSRAQERFKVSAFVNDQGKLESRPIEDMDPLLPREELKAIMNKF